MASLHQPFERTVVLAEPQLLVLVGFSFVDQGESPVLYTPLCGGGENIHPGGGKLWVRAISLFGTFSKEANINDRGEFKLNETPYCDYFVTVYQGLQALKTQRFRKTVKEEQLVIQLGKDAP